MGQHTWSIPHEPLRGVPCEHPAAVSHCPGGVKEVHEVALTLLGSKKKIGINKKTASKTFFIFFSLAQSQFSLKRG
jgi:hypothetical protein